MILKQSRSFIGMGALSLACASGFGCVADRPSRNGVFSENSYIRKAFLVQPGENGKEDAGWYMKATVVNASTPNPLANLDFWPGVENGGSLVRFALTNDKVQMLNLKEISNLPEAKDQGTRIPEVMSAWSATHVDLKYRINLDGEKTNFYEENQELAWPVRQWVKVNLANNEMGDFAPWGTYFQTFLEKCVDTSNISKTLVPDSLHVDEAHDYMAWQVNVTLPVQFDDEACIQGYGEEGVNFQKLGRQSVSMTLMYSLVRAQPYDPADPTGYQPLVLGEKDPIKRKYGPINSITINRDPDSQLLAARQLVWRYNPEKDIVYYLAPGYPEKYKKYFTGPGGIVEQTNAILEQSGAKARLVVKSFDEDLAEGEPPREIGDVRYSFIRWQSDLDVGSPFLGVAQFVADPRTGEVVSTTINIADAPLKDFVVHRIETYLKTLGSSLAEPSFDSATPWGPPEEEVVEVQDDGTSITSYKPLPESCPDGAVAPLQPSILKSNHNGRSSLFNKIQEYLGKPVGSYGNLGPQDFVAQQDDEFTRAYFAMLPYTTYADPDTNPYVIPEGGQGVFGPAAQLEALAQESKFHKLAREIDRGRTPYVGEAGTDMIRSAAQFLGNLKQLQLDHQSYEYKKQFRLRSTNAQFDSAEIFSLPQVMQRASRMCVGGRWETKEEWMERLLDSYHAQTVWHEFGHVLGLEHNFMGSVDRPNYPHYKSKDYKGQERDVVGLYSSTVMDYNNTADRVAWGNDLGIAGWGPYDRGAIAWIYANNVREPITSDQQTAAKGASGQLSPTSPWKDPLGWKGDQEVSYLFCTHEHIKYSPLCRQFDFGSTPSEIIASELDNYEWQYRWRNFRTYRKYWDNSGYANTPANEVYQIRRFLAMWGVDWDETKLIDTWRRIGIKPPAGTASSEFWYDHLADKFTSEMSAANQLVAAFHKAVIQQASGERPYRTIYDDFFGDSTQQGIILDKLFAMQGFVGMWPVDNYDPDQAGGYIASFSSLGDEKYRAVAEDAVTSMIGEQFYDAYPYFKPLAIVQYQMDTHSPNFSGRIEARDWAGGYVFTRNQDMLDFFRRIAVKSGKLNAACADGIAGDCGCSTVESCTYDPTAPRVAAGDTYHSDIVNEFLGPEGRRWAWQYIQDRNTWVFADRDRNTATYKIVNDYSLEILKQEEERDRAYSFQLPLKYFLDAFNVYN